MTQPLTDDEQQTLREGAYGAVFLVANAEPGVIDMVRESFAASKVLAGSSGVVRDALTRGGLPDLPRSAVELETRVLPALTRSMRILTAKAPADAGRYADWVVASCERAAAAAHGVQHAESVQLEKIRSALGAGAGGAGGAGGMEGQ